MDLTKLKMLIVDDEKAILNSLRFLFHRDYCVEIAESAEEALALIQEGENFHLILSDQRMPGMQGHEFLQKTHEKDVNIVNILITGYSDMESLVKAVNKGHIFGYIAKPWDPNELKILVSRGASHYRLRSQNEELNAKLQKINRELELRVEERTHELQVQKSMLEKANCHLRGLNSQMSKDLDQARVTQHSLLPKDLPHFPTLQIATKYVPVERIGGDIYDIQELKERKLGIILADVTGHGISAALISFLFADLFKTFAPRFTSPLPAIETINETLYNRLEDGKFVTAFYGIFEEETQSFHYVSAGHPPGYVVRPSTKEIFPLETEGTILGQFLLKDFFQAKTFPLKVGDKIFLYTDALIEIHQGDKDQFGLDRLKSALLKYSHLSVEELLDKIYNHISTFSNEEKYDDDVTIIAIEILPSS